MTAQSTGIQFFDCNATVGTSATPPLGGQLSAEDLLGEMDRLDIDQSLVCDAFAQELDYREGNAWTIRAAATSPRLHPLATLFPTPGCDDPHAELRSLVAQGCKGVRVHPNPAHHIMDEAVYARQYPLATTALGVLLGELERRRMPLFVELVQTTWSEIYDLCAYFPSLPVVLLNVSYTHKRSLYAGFEQFPNLRCDTSTFHAYRGLEEVCELFGADRMVFGSRLPTYDAVAAIAMVLYADITAAERRLIAGGNLSAMLQAAGG